MDINEEYRWEDGLFADGKLHYRICCGWDGEKYRNYTLMSETSPINEFSTTKTIMECKTLRTIFDWLDMLGKRNYLINVKSWEESLTEETDSNDTPIIGKRVIRHFGDKPHFEE